MDVSEMKASTNRAARDPRFAAAAAMAVILLMKKAGLTEFEYDPSVDLGGMETTPVGWTMTPGKIRIVIGERATNEGEANGQG